MAYLILSLVAFEILLAAAMIFTPKGRWRTIFANSWLSIGGITMGIADITYGDKLSWFCALFLLAGVFFGIKAVLTFRKDYVEGEEEF